MPRYSYIALDDYGKRVKGTLISATEETLKKALTPMGLYLISSRKVHDRALRFSFKKRVRRRDLINFTIHLRTLISAGVPLVQGLEDLVEQTDNKRLKTVLDDVQRNIQAGATFSEALMLHPEIFSETYVNIVRAGETTGKLDMVLQDLTKFLDWNDELISNIRQATLYPAIVVTAVIGLIILLFTFVFPRFIVIFQSVNVELPLPTKIVIWVSEFFRDNILYIVAASIVIVLSVKFFGRSAGGRLRIDRAKLKTPVMGDLITKIEASRFCHYLSLLIKAGVDTTQSLWVVERVVKNRFIAEKIHMARDDITAGGFMSASLKKSGIFPPVVTRMISAGESSGNLDETLEKVSQYFDRELPLAVKRTFAILEPLIIVILAVIVLGAALSMFLALYKMVGAFSIR